MVNQPQQNNGSIELSNEDLAKIAMAREKFEGAKGPEVDPEDYFLAEFGYYYGLEGVQAVLDNTILMPDAQQLLAATNKVYYTKLSEQAHIQLIATVAGNSSEPIGNFKKLMKTFHKAAEVTE